MPRLVVRGFARRRRRTQARPQSALRGPSSKPRYRLGEPSEAVEHAEDVAQQTVAALRDARVYARHIGRADPAVALSDGLRTCAADRVIVIRHRSSEGRFLEDVPVETAGETFGVPLTELTVESRRA